MKTWSKEKDGDGNPATEIVFKDHLLFVTAHKWEVTKVFVDELEDEVLIVIRVKTKSE